MRGLQQLRSRERTLMPSDSHGLNGGSITCPCGQPERICLRQTGTLEQAPLLDCSVPHPIQLKKQSVEISLQELDLSRATVEKEKQ